MAQWETDLTTRTGFTFHVRPVRGDDAAALQEFFGHVSPEDLRFRFLSTVKKVGQDRLRAMTEVDHQRTENFVAIDPETDAVIATAMLACDPAMAVGEVAISIRQDFKSRGVSWELLGYVSRFAQARGVGRLESIEDRSNLSAISLEKEMGFTSRACPGDPTVVVLEKQLRPLAGALDAHQS
ncbi:MULTISPECIES: GNAT family N-acetyltransferase [unclassified Devosia]|uniref:GNAT family N-acetyltransferase n=1 Tax=unclassified Devosia TaxID=196773 RepID=UPI000FDC538B|nr:MULTISPECIES: GNAT family N-acetyltransferase [unclassified Devosia]